MKTSGYLGIDAGTQGLSIVFVDQQLKLLAMGEAPYDFVADLPEGCYEQNPVDWRNALQQAMQKLRAALPSEHSEIDVLSIGISGQMHGEVLVDQTSKVLGPARLWCDSRNEPEGQELTSLFNVKVPKRMTVARWLWTIRNQADKAARVAKITTPSGWLAFELSGQWNLGVGDAAGMFPIDPLTLDYDQAMLTKFDALTNSTDLPALKNLLPHVVCAGDDAGSLTKSGSQLLGLPIGIPMAAAEGDQPASLAGSLIGETGMVSVSFGTSVCANSVGDRPFNGVHRAVDHFCAPDGKPINMVWLRNGTTYMNTIVEMFGNLDRDEPIDGFAVVMPQVLQAGADCGGILALPFMDDEPGLGVNRGGSAMLFGLNPQNATPGNTVKAALVATMFNLKLGSEVLDNQGFPRQELVLTGGVTRTPQLGQVLADVFNTRTTLLDGASEGTAWGAALLAAYRFRTIQGPAISWTDYLSQLTPANKKEFQPNAAAAADYEKSYQRYKKLIELHPQLDI